MFKRILAGTTALTPLVLAAAPALADSHSAIDGMTPLQHLAYHADLTWTALQMGDFGLAWAAFTAQALCTTDVSWLLFSPAGLLTTVCLVGTVGLGVSLVRRSGNFLANFLLRFRFA